MPRKSEKYHTCAFCEASFKTSELIAGKFPPHRDVFGRNICLGAGKSETETEKLLRDMD